MSIMNRSKIVVLVVSLCISSQINIASANSLTVSIGSFSGNLNPLEIDFYRSTFIKYLMSMGCYNIIDRKTNKDLLSEVSVDQMGITNSTNTSIEFEKADKIITGEYNYLKSKQVYIISITITDKKSGLIEFSADTSVLMLDQIESSIANLAYKLFGYNCDHVLLNMDFFDCKKGKGYNKNYTLCFSGKPEFVGSFCSIANINILKYTSGPDSIINGAACFDNQRNFIELNINNKVNVLSTTIRAKFNKNEMVFLSFLDGIYILDFFKDSSGIFGLRLYKDGILKEYYSSNLKISKNIWNIIGFEMNKNEIKLWLNGMQYKAIYLKELAVTHFSPSKCRICKTITESNINKSFACIQKINFHKYGVSEKDFDAYCW